MKENKKSYEEPKVRVIEVEVERGFAASNDGNHQTGHIQSWNVEEW